MTIQPPVDSTAPAATNAPQRDPAKILDAAKQFEALMIGQLLKVAQEGSDGGWAGEDNQSSNSVMQLAGEQLAQALSAQGGLGLARMVVEGLSSGAPKNSNPG